MRHGTAVNRCVKRLEENYQTWVVCARQSVQYLPTAATDGWGVAVIIRGITWELIHWNSDGRVLIDLESLSVPVIVERKQLAACGPIKTFYGADSLRRITIASRVAKVSYFVRYL